MKHKPATPLPYDLLDRPRQPGGEHLAGVYVSGNGAFVSYSMPQATKEQEVLNAAYIAHSCNAYPRLVEALTALLDSHETLERECGSVRATQYANTRALLRELGEL